MNETQHVEFKQSWRDEYIKWICGFANAHGGVIFIGKNDKGHVIGVSNAPKLMEDIPNKVRDMLGILVDVNLHSQDEKDYIEIVTEAYPYPISHQGRYYYRSGSTKQELKGSALDKFILRKQGRRWDGVPVPNVLISDLKSETFELFKHKASRSGRLNDEALSGKNELLIENLMLREGKYLKRSAILLFHADPEKFVTGAYIKIGFFQNEADLIYQDEIHGNLFEQADIAMDLLTTKYLKAYIKYEGIQRIEKFLFPKEALREALLNAIVHKDYSSSVPIQIRVYEDKIIFWNSGELPANWTVEKLYQEHSSIPFNPDIANAFFRAGSIESWGRGIMKIITECHNYGLDTPIYEFDGSTYKLIFKTNIPDKKKETLNETLNETLKINDIQNIMINEILKNHNITFEELAQKTGKSRATIARNIAILKDMHLLKRIGSDKTGYWEIVKKENK